jgi:phosphoglycerol transferase MdoB-like AlkP superfamily enzyme
MFAMSVTQAEYIHDYAFKNLLQVNLEADPGRAYSAAAWKHAASASGLATQCEAGLSQRPSVIVLVVESLSTYHSHLLSGLHDDTPNLDRLAQAASYFPDFRANGYSTEGGLIALLTGRAPIPTAGRLGSAMAFVDVEGDFHRRLREHGYRSLFFTSGRLDFGERDRWLAAIGIEYAEGADHPFYAGMARGPFDAASDGALFDRFLQWHARAGAQPFMATILTVSTHPPYVGADGRPDEAQRFREVDRQIARFAGALGARGFFRAGVMVIVGDHRAMTPISDVEQRRLGDAEVRVPAVILGSSGLARGAIAGNMQQTDLIPSLAHLMFERSCRNEWQGRFLGENPQPARYVVHADPMRRNHVIAVEGNARYTLALDGDDTHWRTAPPRPQDADRLREEVNRERMSRMVEFRGSP